MEVCWVFTKKNYNMKKTLFHNILFAAVLIILVISCKGTETAPTPDPTDEQLQALMNNGSAWVLGAGGVEKDGYNVTDQFTGFKLTIGEFTYSAQNGVASAWPNSGTWSFNNGNSNFVLRDDGVVISVAFNGATLLLTFTINSAGGRSDGITGEYIFQLVSE